MPTWTITQLAGQRTVKGHAHTCTSSQWRHQLHGTSSCKLATSHVLQGTNDHNVCIGKFGSMQKNTHNHTYAPLNMLTCACRSFLLENNPTRQTNNPMVLLTSKTWQMCWLTAHGQFFLLHSVLCHSFRSYKTRQSIGIGSPKTSIAIEWINSLWIVLFYCIALALRLTLCVFTN